MTVNTNSGDPKEAIIEALRNHPEGLTFKDISEIVGHHRHTITKYVYELIGARVILERHIGAAKLCYLREDFEGRDGVMKKEGGKGYGFPKGQAQLAALFMLLLLVPATLIVAQNFTNSSGPPGGMLVAFANISGSGNISYEINLKNLNLTNIADFNFSLDDSYSNVTDNITGSVSPEAPLNFTVPDGNHTDDGLIPEPNATAGNITVPDVPEPEENATLNITLPEDVNVTEEGEGNISVNLTENITIPLPPEDANLTGNITDENETSNATMPEENMTPSGLGISITIISPERAARGGQFGLKAVIENRGDAARNVMLEWVLPEYLAISEGDGREDIGTLVANSTCVSEITVFSTADAALGRAEIKVRVSYE